MNNIIANFEQILKFAASYGLPPTKKRGILREYLQSKILEIIYNQRLSLNLLFVGGTSLRLLRGLDRFSEDLDFNVINLTTSQIEGLMNTLIKQLKQQNLEIDFYRNKTRKRTYYEIRFKNLLYELGISLNPEEKLTIKFDFEKFWKGQQKELVLFNRYGFLTEITTISLNQMLTQKVFAYINRQQTLPRDMYDIVWLYSQGAKIDWKFINDNRLPKNLIQKALAKFNQDKRHLNTLARKLRPFLINESNLTKLSLLPKVLERLKKEKNQG